MSEWSKIIDTFLIDTGWRWPELKSERMKKMIGMPCERPKNQFLEGKESMRGKKMCTNIFQVDKLDKKQPGKGDIMSRTTLFHSLGWFSLLLFFAAFSVTFTAQPAQAEGDMVFRDLSFDFYRQGELNTANHSLRSASAILAASDTDNDFYGDRAHINGDGKLSTAASQMGKYMQSVWIKKPVIANMEVGEPMVLVTVIEDVTTSWVSEIQTEGDNSAAYVNRIIDMVTADFSADIFHYQDQFTNNETLASDRTAATKFSNVHPNNVTGVGFNARNLGLANTPNDASALVVVWYLPSQLVVSATDGAATAKSLSATVAIHGGILADHYGPSNLVGVETENSGPAVVYNGNWQSGIAITGVTDTVSRELFENMDEVDPWEISGDPLDPFDDINFAIPLEVANSGYPHLINEDEQPINVRSDDLIHMQFEVNPNITLDGEPDEYFEDSASGSGGGTDDLILSATGSGLSGLDANNESYGGVAYIKGELLVDGQNVFTVDDTYEDGLEERIDFADDNILSASRQFNFTRLNNLTAGNVGIIDVSTQISSALITTGTFARFTSQVFIADDARPATYSTVIGAADTSNPFISSVTAQDAFGREWGEIGSASKYATAAVTVHVLPGGERGDKYAEWLHVTVLPDANINDVGLFSLNKPNTNEIRSSSAGPKAIDNIPSGRISGGASATLFVSNDNSITVLSASFVVSVSDDARNPAFSYSTFENKTLIADWAKNATIDSATDNRSVTNDDQDNLVYRQINSSTVSIDNTAPVVLGATFSVTGMPSGYWHQTPDSNPFGLLRNASEILEAPINIYSPSGEVGNGILNVTKGTAALTGSGLAGIQDDQSGSPVRLVVEFQPTSTAAKGTDDDDDDIVEGESGISYLNRKFKFDIASPRIGWITGAAGALPTGWSLVDATFHTGSDKLQQGENVAFATFENDTGIPQIAANRSALDVSMFVTIGDKLINYPGFDAHPVPDTVHPATSNAIIVDVSRPLVGFNVPNSDTNTGVLSSTLTVSGLGKAASTILFITNTLNKNINELSIFKGYSSVDNINVGALAKEAVGASGFVNSKAGQSEFVGSATGIEAGYMIIISATFQEPTSLTVGEADPQYLAWSGGIADGVVGGASAAFPYLLTRYSAGEPGQASYTIDNASTEYGRLFKTISADFTDFVDDLDYAADLPPDVSRVIYDETNREVGSATYGAIISATWFFLIDSTKDLEVDAKNDEDIRYVTITSRDLSGNVHSVGIPVATAAFIKPLPELVEAVIFSEKMGIPDGARVHPETVPGDFEGTSGSLPAARLISRASTNLNDATMRVVIKIDRDEDSTSPIEKYDTTNTTGYPVQMHLQNFGGGVINPSASRVIGIGGGDQTIVEATNASILWATFTTSKFTTELMAGATQAIVYATGSTLGVGEVKVPPGDNTIDHDSTVPQNVEISDFMEQSFVSGDILDDNLVRPGQDIIFNATFDLDNFGQDRTDNITVLADLSDFGFTELQKPSWPSGAANRFGTQLISGDTKLLATWEFKVPSDPDELQGTAVVWVTDAVKNQNSAENNIIQIDKTAPQVVTNILSASMFINLATDNYGTDQRRGNFVNTPYFEVGRKRQSGSDTVKNSTTIVSTGDKVKLEAIYNVNDSVFSTLDPTADFSHISGQSSLQPSSTKALAGLYYATWIVEVEGYDVIENRDVVEVTLSAVDPAGETLEDSEDVVSVPVITDVSPPEVKVTSVKWYKNGKEVTSGIINPRDLGAENSAAEKAQKGFATATVVVEATFTDAGKLRGYAGSPLIGLAERAGLSIAEKNELTAANVRSITPLGSWVHVDPNVTPENGAEFVANSIFNNGDIAPYYWEIDGLGPRVAGGMYNAENANSPSWASSAQLIRESSNFHVVAYFGYNPRDSKIPEGVVRIPGIKIKEDQNNSSAKFIANVSDSVGNIGSVNSDTIIVDSHAPEINPKVDKKRKVNDAVGDASLAISTTVQQQPWVDYVPAVYAGDVIVRPTRVKKGTYLDVTLWVKEDPVAKSQIDLAIDTQGNNGVEQTVSGVFDGVDASITNGIAYDSLSGEADGNHAFRFTPVDEPQQVVMTFKLATDSKEKVASTYDNNNGTPDANPSEKSNWGYTYNPGLPGNALMQGSTIVIYVTDEMQNTNINTGEAKYGSTGLEIDDTGPTLVKGKYQENIVPLTSLEEVNALSRSDSILKSMEVNYLPSQWLVYAATYVVDGTEGAHFQNFFVNWAGAFETDTKRFVRVNESDANPLVYSGTKFLVESATRSVIFVTNAVQIKSDSSPSTAQEVRIQVRDALGNWNDHDMDRDDDGNDDPIAINARGPSAVELNLIVNGVSESAQGASLLGIGNNEVDNASAQFEFTTGDMLSVEALITTIEGEAPDTIYLDASDLYPNGMSNLVDQLIPSATELTPQGTIRAVWDDIAFDFTGAVVNEGADIDDASRWFFDQSVLHALIGNTGQYIPDHPLGIIGDRAGVDNFNGLHVFNGPIVGVTPVEKVDFDAMENGVGFNRTNNASERDTLNAIVGLPKMKVQEGAIAKRVAWVTVFVFDNDSLFEPEESLSAQFTVDVSPPVVTWEIPSDSIVRTLTPTQEDQRVNTYSFDGLPDVPDDGIKGGRVGFPSAPGLYLGNKIDTIPNRVRAGDTLSVIVDATNTLIDQTGDDRFRTLPGVSQDGIFSIASNSGLLDVTVNFSEFNINLSDISTDQEVIPTSLSITQQTDAPSFIRATYEIPVGLQHIGDSVAKSKKVADITPTVVDDAGNKPYDTVYDVELKQRITPPLAVDNQSPTISGTLDVVVQKNPEGMSYGAVFGTQQKGVGQVVPSGSRILAGAVLRITATVSDQIDSPIDVINNPNYGIAALTADNIVLQPADIVVDISRAKLTGPDSVAIPFDVRIPTAEGGSSTPSFKFIIRATDTIGNATSKQSNASFTFDAKPIIATRYQGVALETEAQRTITVDAGAQTVISATGFDAGELTSIRWIVVPSGVEALGLSTTPAEEDFELTQTDQQTGELDLNINPQITADSVNILVATAAVKDDLDNEVFSGQHIININQPALFASVFEATETNSAGAVVEGVTEARSDVTGLQLAADQDVREVTIPEGSILEVDVIATDASLGTITLGATGTGMISEAIKSSAFAGSGGQYLLTLEPGYEAVTGAVEAATYVVDITASDGLHMSMDNTRLLVNVTAQPATPAITIVSVEVGGAESSKTSVSVRETQELQVVLQATDEGGEDVDISVDAPESVLTSTGYSLEEVMGTGGVTDATVTFTPDVEFSDIPGNNNPDDPFDFTFTATNVPEVGTPVSNDTELAVDVTNESQPPVITTSVSVDGGAAVSIDDGDTVATVEDQSLVFSFLASDPDGDTVQFPTAHVLDATDFVVGDLTVTNIQASFVEAQLTMTTPAAPPVGGITATVVFTATDSKLTVNEESYYVAVAGGEPPIEEVDVDEVVVAAGQGGIQSVNVKNVDPNSSVPVNGTIRGFRGAPLAFLQNAAIGGGVDRAVYMSAGDLNNDDQLDVAITLGPVTEQATAPNVVLPRDLTNKLFISGPFYAFPSTGTGGVVYGQGELKTAIGNFIGSSTNQIAVAQGVGGKTIIRLYQHTGLPFPLHYKLVGQIQGLTGSEWVNNASGGINLAAGDIDSDGMDELFVAQTNSLTSQTTFNVIDIEDIGDAGVAAGTIAGVSDRVTGLKGFHLPKFRGDGGIEVVTADLNGDGELEILVASSGDINKKADPFLNLLGVLKPVLTDGKVSSVSYVSGYVQNMFSETTNPSGAISVAAGELDGNTENGDEVVVTTGAYISVDDMNVTAVKPAPANKYFIVKINMTTDTVSAWSRVTLPSDVPITPLEGVTAFVGGFAPSSGGLSVIVGNTDTPEIGN